MKLSARECIRKLFCLKIFTIILTLVAFTACVSQKPKSAVQNDASSEQSTTEATAPLSGTNAEAAAPQATQSAETGSQAAPAEKQQEAAVTPEEKVQEKPELIAVYKKSPRQKELVVVLLNPPIPEPAKTNAQASQPAQTGTSQQAQAPSAMPAQQSSQSSQNASQQKPASNTQTNQTSAATPPAQKPAQTAAAPGTAGSTASNSGSSTPAANTVQPAIPFAPASSSAAITATPSTPVPAKELVVEKNKPFTITLDGNGWIYLGDEFNRQGIRYESRQLIDNQIVYRLNGDRTGEFLLRFQRDNPITQLPETQYIKVTVADGTKSESSAGTQGSQTAPINTQAAAGGAALSTASSGAAAGAPANQPALVTSGTVLSGTTSSAGATGSTSGGTAASGSVSTAGTAQTAAGATGNYGATSNLITAPSGTVNTAPAGMQTAPITRDMLLAMTDAAAVLEIARTQLAQKQIALVLGALDRYLVLNPAGSDEVLYLYALAYEQDTPYRDIQKAYAYYKQLVREYPLSTYRQYALERITYLERFYPGLR